MRTLHLFLCAVLALVVASPAEAINVFWDDGGSGKSWTTANNWSPNQRPDNDDVFVGNLAAAVGDSTTLDDDFAINSLTISNAADVDTAKFFLKVSGPISVSGAGSTLTASEHVDGSAVDAINAASITAGLNGAFVMNGGRTVLADSSAASADLIVGVNSFFAGYGQLQFNDTYGAGISPLVNDGSLTTQRESGSSNATRFTLSIDSSAASAPLDLDGFAGNGTVGVTSQTTLDINQPITPFGSTMTLNPGAELDINTSWALNGTVSVNAGSPLPGVAPQATIDGGTVVVNPGAGVFVNSGELVIDAGTNFQPGSTLQLGVANSAITFNAPASVLGTFAVPSSSGLAINVNDTVTIGSTPFDWDGAENSVTNISPTGQLTINSTDISPSAVDDTFDGTINITGGRLVANVVGGWQMGGTVNIAFGSGIAGRLGGSSPMTVVSGGLINHTAGFGQIGAPVIFEPGSSTVVAPNSNGKLIFTNSVTFQGGSSHTGAGRLSFDSTTTTVNGATTINMTGDVLLDEDAANNDTTLTLNNDFTVNAASVGVFGAGSVAAGIDLIAINNANATLTVNQSSTNTWTLGPDGVITINGSGTITTTLAGDDLVVLGLVDVTNITRLGARLDIGSTGTLRANTATIAVTPQARLGGGSINNPNTISGGQISSGGEIVAENGKALYGYGFVDANVRFLGNSELIAEGGQLFVNGAVLDVGVIGVAGPGSQLVLANAYSTPAGSAIELRGGLVTALAGATNTTEIRGYGTLNPGVMINNGTIRTQGGVGQELVIAAGAGTLNLDGTTENGSLEVTGGNLRIDRPLSDAFNGIATVGFDTPSGIAYSLEINEDWTLAPSGTLNLNGSATSFATLRGAGEAQLNGTLNVGNRANISANANLGATATVNLDENEQLRVSLNQLTVDANATFVGGGLLWSTNSGTVMLRDGVDTEDVILVNDRRVRLGTAADMNVATATTFFYDQLAFAQLFIDIGGTDPSRYDRLVATNGANLAGDLDIDLISGFVPSLGDTFDVLLTPGGQFGNFAAVNTSDATIGGGLTWQVRYTGTAVRLEVVEVGLPGDYNNDNVVDVADYTLWRDSLGDTINLTADGDRDGIVDQDDYDVWVNNFGAMGPAIAVPEPAGLLLVGVGMMLVPRRRRR
ncbi:hypothetical protein [Botrimarina hoheduenensis]|uniref:Autotransporter-associated beta strand repeat protein n=1 Tax=Botrimarina hoheduenensis TaxID=2528000 RepID=A0A5C5WA28_9BACT|nr:hypothetical protein [Botrimarina hoheduenensis]TWT47347.1 hypothetical protein Pla111_09600 [Botrimarina hoheduenensis]